MEYGNSLKMGEETKATGRRTRKALDLLHSSDSAKMEPSCLNDCTIYIYFFLIMDCGWTSVVEHTNDYQEMSRMDSMEDLDSLIPSGELLWDI